jgi:hypothetical protein
MPTVELYKGSTSVRTSADKETRETIPIAGLRYMVGNYALAPLEVVTNSYLGHALLRPFSQLVVDPVLNAKAFPRLDQQTAFRRNFGFKEITNQTGLPVPAQPNYVRWVDFTANEPFVWRPGGTLQDYVRAGGGVIMHMSWAADTVAANVINLAEFGIEVFGEENSFLWTRDQFFFGAADFQPIGTQITFPTHGVFRGAFGNISTLPDTFAYANFQASNDPRWIPVTNPIASGFRRYLCPCAFRITGGQSVALASYTSTRGFGQPGGVQYPHAMVATELGAGRVLWVGNPAIMDWALGSNPLSPIYDSTSLFLNAVAWVSRRLPAIPLG